MYALIITIAAALAAAAMMLSAKSEYYSNEFLRDDTDPKTVNSRFLVLFSTPVMNVIFAVLIFMMSRTNQIDGMTTQMWIAAVLLAVSSLGAAADAVPGIKRGELSDSSKLSILLIKMSIGEAVGIIGFVVFLMSLA